MKILRTVDGGENWTDVTPQGQDGLSISSIVCRDGQNAVLAFTRESSPQIIVCRTTDGGQNWAKSEINTGSDIPAGEKPVKLSFSDAEHGWLLAGYGLAMGSEVGKAGRPQRLFGVVRNRSEDFKPVLLMPGMLL